jgi:BASS family bile acid:Na+ symporter
MKSVLEIFKVLLGVAIPLASFATGLRAARVQAGWLAKHPGLFARALITLLLLLPVGTVLFLESIGAPPLVRAGLTIAVIAIGIGPPAIFGYVKAHAKAQAAARDAGDVPVGAPVVGDALSFEVSLNIVLLAVSIVYIPAFIAVHGMFFQHHLHLAPAAIAKVVLGRALVPLALGLALGRFAPRLVGPVVRYAGIFVQLVLLLVVVFAIVATWHQLTGLGGRTWLTCAAVVLAEIVIGYLLGGPAVETRRVLASFSAMRFPALALLIASITPRAKELTPVILAYVLTSFVLVSLQSALTAPRKAKTRGAAGGPGTRRIYGGAPSGSGAS